MDNDAPRQLIYSGGTNSVYQMGDKFVKKIDARVGSPHAEEHAARVFDLGGIPNLGARAGEHLGPGVPTVAARYVPDLEALDQARPGKVPKLDPGRVAAQLAGEYAAGVYDRHAGNYAVSPTTGFFSIDHGQAFHPYTADRLAPTMKRRTAGLADADHWWVGSRSPALEQFLVYNGYDPGEMGEFVVPPDVVRNLLSRADAVERAAHAGTVGLDERERRLAAHAAALRMRFLRAHAVTGRPVTVDTLHEAADQVKAHVRAHLPSILASVG